MTNDRIEHLSAWLAAHEEEMIADIAGLVTIPTLAREGEGGYPYGPELARAVEYMAGLAQRYGFAWQNHDWHCVSISYGSGDQQLGIWGHLDVVEPGEGWIYEPFACQRVKNYLLGRGTQDNKAPDIGSLYVLRYLKEHNIVPGFEIRLIYGCQEETGMKDVEAYLEMEKAPDYSFVVDCGFPVCYGERGFLRVTLNSLPLGSEVTELSGGQAVNTIPASARAVVMGKGYEAAGIGGHSAFPEGKVNALGKLGESLLAVEGLSEVAQEAFRFLAEAGGDGYGRALGIARADEPSGPMSCAPTVLSLRDGAMEVVVNIRYPISCNGDDVVAELAQCCAGYGLKVTDVSDSKPNREDPQGPWAQFLTGAFEAVMGERQEPYVMSGGTYARKIPNAVGFGPGLPKDLTVLGLPDGHGECHQPDESQCLDTLYQAWRVYAYTVLELIDKGLPTS